MRMNYKLNSKYTEETLDQEIYKRLESKFSQNERNINQVLSVLITASITVR